MINWTVIAAPVFYVIYIILKEKLIFLKLLFLKYSYLSEYKM